MNYLDIIIATPILYGLIKGFFNGLIKEISGFLGFLIGVYIAINFSTSLQPNFIKIMAGHEQFIPIISFAILFIVGLMSIKLLAYFLDKITKFLALGFVSKLLGAIFGGLKIVVILSFILTIAGQYDVIEKNTEKESVLIEPLKETSEVIMPEIQKQKNSILEKAKKAKEKLNPND